MHCPTHTGQAVGRGGVGWGGGSEGGWYKGAWVETQMKMGRRKTDHAPREKYLPSQLIGDN